MKTFFRYTGAFLSLIVLAAAVGAVILYQKGVYDFSFAPRSYAADEHTADTEPDSQTTVPDTTIALEVDDNISGVFDPDSFGGNETQPVAETTAETAAPSTPAVEQTVYPTASSLKSSGYKCTSSTYSRNTHKLALVTGGVEIDRALMSNGKYTLSTYMGYIIYNKGISAYALGINGVVSVAGIQNLTPAYLRDSVGHPLWISGDKYYYLVDNSNNMIEVTPDLNYSPVLRFDYPIGYGTASETLKRYYAETEEARKIDTEGNDVTDEVDHALSEAVKAGYDIEDPNVLARLKLPEYTVQAVPCIRWGYVNQYNQIVIPAQYYFASEFDSTGHAVVAGRYGIVNVINTYGSIAITLRSAVLYPEELIPF